MKADDTRPKKATSGAIDRGDHRRRRRDRLGLRLSSELLPLLELLRALFFRGLRSPLRLRSRRPRPRSRLPPRLRLRLPLLFEALASLASRTSRTSRKFLRLSSPLCGSKYFAVRFSSRSKFVVVSMSLVFDCFSASFRAEAPGGGRSPASPSMYLMASSESPRSLKVRYAALPVRGVSMLVMWPNSPNDACKTILVALLPKPFTEIRWPLP